MDRDRELLLETLKVLGKLTSNMFVDPKTDEITFDLYCKISDYLDLDTDPEENDDQVF